MKTNKLLSVVLTLCVLLAAFSLTALAADGETYPIAVAYCVEGDENGVVEEYAAENLQNAINEIAKTAAMFEATAVKMTLQADVTGVASTLTVPAGTEFTLDLAGHTLEGNNQGKDQAFLLVNGKLTLTDSVGTGKVCSTYTGTAGRVVSVVGGELTVAGGTITTEGMAKAGNAIYVSKGSTLSMTGGKVYADAKRGNYAIRIGGKDAIFTMTGGVAEADSSTTETYITAIDVSSTGTGTIGGDSVVRGPKALTTTSLTALTVTGGSFTGEVSAPKNSISGGTFTDVDVISLAGYVDETVYACEKQADGSYTVAKAEFTAVATITGTDGVVTRYAAATEAFSALKGGDTLKLLADIGTAAEPLPYGIVVTDGDVNVNLNAKTLIIGYDAAAAAAAGVPGYAAGVGIVNGGSGTVTVSGNGTLDVSNYTGTDGIAVWARTGSITVQSGTFINKSNEEATVYVGTNDDSSPVLTIAGGTYKNIAEGNYKYDESRTPLTFNIYNGKTADALKISAGSFYGNNDPYLGDDQVKGSILATEKRTGVKKTTDGYKVAAGQGIQVLDANGGAKNFYTGASTSSTGKLAVALADAADGDTLILLKNISASSQLNVTKAITIDLGGYTLTNSYDGSGYSLLTRAAVTMKNGTYKSTKGSARGIGAVADFTLENATLSAAGLVGLGCSAPDATYTVKNSTVIGNYALANFVNNAKINIESSTITGSGVGIYHNGSNSGLKLTAADSTITAAATGATNGIYVSGSTSTMTAAGAQQVTLTRCTVSGGTAVEVKYTDLTLTDCTVTATTETPSYTQDDNGAATTGFAVVSTDNTTGAATPAPKGTITIQGANGSYKGQVGLASLETVKTEYADFKDTTYAVSGGSFTKAVLPEYCAEGFVPAANADGTYGVKVAPVAKIGTVEYATLAEAIAAAKDGDTVTLTADINTPETSYYIQKSLTIDLGGKTLTGSGYDGVFNIEGENAAVLIKNGKIVAVEQTGTAGKYTMAVWACAAGCEVTLEDLDVSQQITHTDDKQMDMIYTSNGTIIINSGCFTSGTPAWTLNCKDSAYKAGTAKIIVNGGTFVGYDPRNNTAEGAGTSFVAPGVGVDAVDGSFTAKAGMTAQIVDADGNSVAAYAGHYDAIAAAKDGEKVILLSDRKNFVTNTIGANITIDLNGKTLSLGNNNPFFRTNGEVTIQNGTIDSNVACVIVNAYNKLTLKNVKITGVTGNNGKNLVNVCSNAEVTIDKDTVLTASGSNGAAVFIGQDADAKYTLNVYGKVIQESKSFAISGNGSYKGTTTINIYDGAEVKSASVAIYHPQAGVINVNGGLVEGYCAIGIKSGTLNINGGTVRGTADDHVLDDSNSTSGTIIYDGSAIVVDSRAAGYAGNVNINVTGGTVESCYSTAIREIGEQDKPNMTQLTKLNVTGGSVLGASQELGNVTNDMLVRDISSSNVSVSGGTFNHAVPETYCADGFVPTKNEDGTYGVKESRYVASVGDAKYETLAEAIAAAAKGSTVTLLADTRENVTIDKALTLDLNGFTLNGGTVEAKPALTITARTVTIKDSSEAQTGTIMREDTAENSGVSSHYVIDIQGNAWVMFESGKVTNNSGSAAGKGASLVRIGDDRVAKQPGLVIKGGTFTQDNFIVIKVGRGYLTLNGGTLNSANSYAIENWFRATIKGGTVNGTAAAWTYSGGFNSTLTVEGGTINGNVFSVNYGSAESKVAKVEITGGTVNGALGTYTYSNGLTATEDATKATIEVTGGTFANDPTKYVVEGATVTKNSEGKFGVEKAYLAKVGNTSYYTMEEAFKAQTASGEPVVLLRDYTTRGTFNSGSSNRTVDLNGHTWTYTGTDFDCAAFEINYPNVTLTVKNGTVVSGSMVGLIPSAMGGTIKYDNSGLVLDGVTATANGNSGIETNGNNTNDTVTLKNSTLNVPNGFGIYFPSSGTLTLDNSTVTAKTMGVQVCAGSLSINEGSAVTVTGDAVPKVEDDGAIQDGAAISVVNRTGYKGLGTVTVSGGEFTAKEGNSAIKAYDWANKTESDFTADKGTVAVSGGTFSSEIKSEYCAEGFEPVANTDGTYGVAEKARVGLSDNMMIIPRGLADGKYTMLILAAIDSLDYAEVGFKVMVYNDGKAVSDETMYSTTTVYTSVKDGAGKVWKPDDSELGDTKCKYLFASTMEIDASDKDAFTLDAYVRVVPYAMDYDGNVLVKNTFNIPITYFFN